MVSTHCRYICIFFISDSLHVHPLGPTSMTGARTRRSADRQHPYQHPLRAASCNQPVQQLTDKCLALHCIVGDPSHRRIYTTIYNRNTNATCTHRRRHATTDGPCTHVSTVQMQIPHIVHNHMDPHALQVLRVLARSRHALHFGQDTHRLKIRLTGWENGNAERNQTPYF